eukprot:2343609-Pyramimonas_sp.AAC.1
MVWRGSKTARLGSGFVIVLAESRAPDPLARSGGCLGGARPRSFLARSAAPSGPFDAPGPSRDGRLSEPRE